MNIKKKCENCANVKYCRHIQEEEFTCYCDNYKYFRPTEKLIRRDERREIEKLIQGKMEHCLKYAKDDNYWQGALETLIDLKSDLHL